MQQVRSVSMVLVAAVLLAATATPAQAGGKIKVQVKREGERPKRTVLKMDADPVCKNHYKKPDGKFKKVGSVGAIVSKDKEVRNAVVYVKEGAINSEFSAPTDKLLLNQVGCMYDPHVLSVMVDQKIVIRNSDPTLHNIHSFAKQQRSFNFAQAKKGMEKEVTFSRAEFVKIKCDVHAWMSAYVAVFDHPYHAVTDKDGFANLSELQPGEYVIGVWHETFGEMEKKITVGQDETKEIEVVYSGS